MKMKMLLMLAMTSALLSGFGPSSARAEGGLAGSGDPFTLTFDENGNGSVDLRNGTILPDPGILLPDVSGGTSTLVLTYGLPSPVVTGDVRIWEDFIGGTLSDVLRFTNANGGVDGSLNGDRVIVYSDIEATGGSDGDKADTGIPVRLVPRDLGGVLEVGPENNNGVVYLPGSVDDNIYKFTSDAVPEPSSILMFGMSALGLVGFAWRRRHRAVTA